MTKGRARIVTTDPVVTVSNTLRLRLHQICTAN